MWHLLALSVFVLWSLWSDMLRFDICCWHFWRPYRRLARAFWRTWNQRWGGGVSSWGPNWAGSMARWSYWRKQYWTEILGDFSVTGLSPLVRRSDLQAMNKSFMLTFPDLTVMSILRIVWNILARSLFLMVINDSWSLLCRKDQRETTEKTPCEATI